MRIAVIGCSGFVGSAMWDFFKPQHDMVGRDVDGGDSWADVNSCDIACVCVPTPMAADGSCDTSIVEDVCNRLDPMGPLALINSTVPPGTSKRLGRYRRVVFSPEFVGQSKYYTGYEWTEDVAKSPWFIFGHTGRRGDADMVADVFMRLASPRATYAITDSTTAELVKYWTNCWSAAKVTLAHEMRRICEASGVSYHEARSLWQLCPWVEPMHTAAHGNGYAGKCFPKDVSAMIEWAKNAGHDSKLWRAIQDANIGLYRRNQECEPSAL